MTLSELLARFPRHTKVGDQVNVTCPAHDDGTASLTIGEGRDGRILLHCKAGCRLEAILARLDLTTRDLFPPTATKTPARTIVATYDYCDEAGMLRHQAVRFEPKGFSQRRPNGQGWIWNLNGVERVLYNLPALRDQSPVFIVEGEKDADRLIALGLAATTNAGGAGKFTLAYCNQLTRAGVQHVVIIPDNDPPGRAHAEHVATSCHLAGLRVQILTLPDLPEKGDVSDFLRTHTPAELEALARGAPVFPPVDAPAPDSPSRGAPMTTSRDQKPPKDSQATKIVREVEAGNTELWHSPNGDAYLTVPVGQHLEHHPLRSGAARDYLSKLYFRRARSAASSSAIADAQDTLSALARFDGQSYPVYVRVAETDGRIYLDLADAEWRAVEIDATGWRVISNPPVRFRRPRGLQPLPVPVRGGSIADLMTFLNVNSDEDFRLCVMWELAALRGRGPYPILVLTAEQGAAKTTASRVLRRLCDPNHADTRRPPRNTEDLMIAAANSHVVAIDNLSRLSDELSDNLSALATGSGFSVRQLYSNDEEHITHACRPIILNGISQFASRGDVLDRAIALTLPRIADGQRKDERTFWREFASAHPTLLGALLEAVSVGVRRVPDVHLPRLPRMADFVLWSVAVEPGCPWPVGRFLSGYGRNRKTAVAVLLEGDPLADVVRILAATGWEGTATELLAEVNQRTPEDVKRRREWFALPKQLSDALRRIVPALRQVGIIVARAPGRNKRGRLIRLRRGSRPAAKEKGRLPASPASPASPPSPASGLFGGLRDAGDARDAAEHHFSVADTEDATDVEEFP